MDPGPRPSPTAGQALLTLRVIALSLGLGVTLFALVSWVLHAGRQAAAPPTDPVVFGAMLLTVVAASSFAIVWWRARVTPLVEAAGRGTAGIERFPAIQTNAIIAWAVVEGAALFAEVVYFLYDDVLAAVLGVALMWGAIGLGWPKREWLGGDA